ncbi:MAG: SRPBCC family protein [bacterium]
MPFLLHQIAIEAPPERVYAALATQKGLRSWWTVDTTVETRVGGSARFGFDKRSTVFRMTIEELIPPKRVVWSCHGDHKEWNGTKLIWDVAPDDSGSVLRFRHANWRKASDFFATCNSTWGELMYRLKAYVEGKNPGPHWTE